MIPPGTTPTSAKKNASFASSRVPNLPRRSRTAITITSATTTVRKISATAMLAA